MLRPVNLRTDLAPLADLIELVFSDTMDPSGRAALREMRMMSRMGAGLNLLSKLNEMAVGISMGMVWIEGGQLVGNVSIYPAHLPKGGGEGWIIANVGVHPHFQRRGIARRLMVAALEVIRVQGGKLILLQVDEDNAAALDLYHGLGFVTERPFTTYKRLPSLRLPPLEHEVSTYVRQRRRSEWRAEMDLAAGLRPNQRGGLGWLRPIAPSLFQPNLWRVISDLLNFRQQSRYVVTDEQGGLAASLWIERAFGLTTRLQLMTQPNQADLYADALLATAIRQFGAGSLILEHPSDDASVQAVLSRFRFMPQRSVIHMRWMPE